MDEQVRTNQERWDELVAIHASSAYYDMDGFKAGRSSLDEIQVEELGDVAGKSLLHLLCHFGMDTLSLAREGARATGTDFSEQAIELARSLGSELGLDAEFVCCDFYDLPQNLEGRFDMILMSYGVIGWLHDLEGWAQIVADYLEPGGRLHLVEFHPFAEMFDDESAVPTLRYPYFRSASAVRSEKNGTYADPTATTEHEIAFSWPAGIGDVFSALVGAGLAVESFREYSWCNEQLRPIFVQGSDGKWRSPPDAPALPIVYSVRATKPV